MIYNIDLEGVFRKLILTH